MTDAATSSACPVLIAGFGRPGMRDLDFGRQVVDCLRQLEWPDGVVVEDLSCAVPLVLHRLQELRPAKVVLLGAVARGLDPPATLRRYRVDPTPSHPTEVQRSLEESVTGLIDLDHTLAVARHWGALPLDTVVVEVEPAEASFGLGFSEELARCIDPIIEMLREELGDLGAGAAPDRPLTADDVSAAAAGTAAAAAGAQAVEPSDGMAELLDYARDHADARRQSGRAPSLVDRLPSGAPGVALAGRVRPWGVYLETGGDWFDAVPLEARRLAIVLGNVAGRGAAVAVAMSDLRAAVRAYLVLDGGSPARVMGNLDRLAAATGLGHQARIVCLVLDPASGEARLTNAGGAPPLVLESHAAGGRFVEAARSGPVGETTGGDRAEAALRLAPGSTLLLFTDGLVESRAIDRATGLDRLRRAAAGGPAPLDDLCDHVLDTCGRGLRRDDDICLLGVRLQAGVVPAPAQPTHPPGR